MQKDVKNFVLVSTSSLHPGEITFWALDQFSGGCPYWTSHLVNAKMFKTVKEVQHLLKTDPDLTQKWMTYDSQGAHEECPRMIYYGADLGGCVLDGTVILSIVKVVLKPMKINYSYCVEKGSSKVKKSKLLL